MILTLLITLLVEGVVVTAYSLWRKKNLSSALLTSFFANVITQSLLWIVLTRFFPHYLIALVVAEFFIWLMEGAALHIIPANGLGLRESMWLSLCMNLMSFGLGWSLPV